MKLVITSLLLAVLLGLASPAEAAVFRASGLYEQSGNLWSTYHDLVNAQQNLPEIDAILSREYGTYEEGVSALRFEEDGLMLDRDGGLLKEGYIALEADATAFGSVDNPVVPVLHADVVGDGSVSAGASGELWGGRTRFGVTGGLGFEKRVDATSTDLIEHFPFRNGMLSFYGFDQHFTKRVPLAELSLGFSLALQETFYISGIDSSFNSFAFRYKEMNELNQRFGNVTAGVQLIFGQQPIPVELLPRTWDYTHQLDAFPELGTLVGAGGHFETSFSKRTSLDALVGVYAGYLGGGLRFRVENWAFSLGSWGIEGRSAYLSEGSRLWSALASAAF